jgi:hypothetical protein
VERYRDREQDGKGERAPTLCNVTVELKLALEVVGRGPGLGEGDTVLGIGVLALDVTAKKDADGLRREGQDGRKRDRTR